MNHVSRYSEGSRPHSQNVVVRKAGIIRFSRDKQNWLGDLSLVQPALCETFFTEHTSFSHGRGETFFFCLADVMQNSLFVNLALTFLGRTSISPDIMICVVSLLYTICDVYTDLT